MVLPRCYGTYSKSAIPSQEVIMHYNFLPRCAVEVTEKYQLATCDPEAEIVIETQGHATLTDYCLSFQRYLKQQQLRVDDASIPVLNEYSGRSKFYRQSGQVADAMLNIELSCGRDYKKRIEYQLKTIGHEEV